MKLVSFTLFFLSLVSCFYLSVIFGGCHQSAAFQFINPAYQNMNQFSTTVLVLSLNNELIDRAKQRSLTGKKDIPHRKLTQQELNYFNNYMGPTLSEVAVANIIGIDQFFDAQEINFEYNDFRTDDGNTLQIFTPASGKLSYNSIIPDYVLFFEDLYFEKDYVEERTGIGRGTNSKYTLDTGIEYLLWDNRKEKIVGYGMITKSLKLFNYPTKENYLNIFEEFANRIIRKSPIAWKKIR